VRCVVFKKRVNLNKNLQEIYKKKILRRTDIQELREWCSKNYAWFNLSSKAA
jgi:hypothetical protein